jgi:hypothetical protein
MVEEASKCSLLLYLFMESFTFCEYSNFLNGHTRIHCKIISLPPLTVFISLEARSDPRKAVSARSIAFLFSAESSTRPATTASAAQRIITPARVNNSK